MFNKKEYTDTELNTRAKIVWNELYKQCCKLKINEFEYHWEMWGAFWMPWFITAGKKSLNFSLNDIGEKDLNILVKQGKIEVVKVYDDSRDKYDRKRYRILESNLKTQ